MTDAMKGRTESRVTPLGRAEYIRRYQARLDEIFTGVSFEAFVVGEAPRLFRKDGWFEIGLAEDLSDAPHIADADKAQDRVAAEAWTVWMRLLEREHPRGLVIGEYRPAEVYETHTDPLGALCAPNWQSIQDANRLLVTATFDVSVCFSESDRWALLGYHESISVLGGSADYMDEFRSLFGGFRRLRENFVEVNERQLGPAWSDNSYRKLPGMIRWPPD